jgi:hypothetical protein
MICERCLKELNAAFEFAERSRSAEKLYFAKRREEFEVEQQEQQTEKTERKKHLLRLKLSKFSTTLKWLS